MPKPIYYFQIIEEINVIVRNVYFISKTPFNVTEINECFLHKEGIINLYINVFPDRKLTVNVAITHNIPATNENTAVYNVKHSNIFEDGIVKLYELSYNGLFTDCDLYKEKGIIAFYDNYEIKEKMYHLNDILEGSCSPCCSYTDEDLDEIDKWTNQPYVF
jgi:hypothetical protein